ncbi:hypothetical protein WDW86_01585 [Bdellovibrionota bacterium FG-2]
MSDYSGSKHRTSEPREGTISQDVAGTAQGIWLKEGVSTVYPEDPHLALVHDPVDPTIAVLSIGTSLEGGMGAWSIPSTTTLGTFNRDFATITPGSDTYCYDSSGLGGVVVLSLDSATSLKVEFKPGLSCMNSAQELALSPRAVRFVR